MTTDRRRIEQTAQGLRQGGAGTKVLVAVEGFFEPGMHCRAGELLWPTPWCGAPGCGCGEEFHGTTSHGTASVGRVQVVRAVPRRVCESAIAEAMRSHGAFDRPDADAAAFLDEVASIEEGRLVRREEDVLLPFPIEARIAGPHRIEYHLSDEP